MPTHNFKDVAGKYDWAADAIDRLFAEGIIKGTSESTFNPEKMVTRADFVLMLVRALGLEGASDSGFTDVREDDYYYEALGIAKHLGLIKGVDGSRFNPQGEITRQDMMVIAARALQLTRQWATSSNEVELDVFRDGSKVAAYARESVELLISQGIIQGDGGYIQPAGTATRAQAAVVVFRILLL